jgi:hypothetical protein
LDYFILWFEFHQDFLVEDLPPCPLPPSLVFPPKRKKKDEKERKNYAPL